MFLRVSFQFLRRSNNHKNRVKFLINDSPAAYLTSISTMSKNFGDRHHLMRQNLFALSQTNKYLLANYHKMTKTELTKELKTVKRQSYEQSKIYRLLGDKEQLIKNWNACTKYYEKALKIIQKINKNNKYNYDIVNILRKYTIALYSQERKQQCIQNFQKLLLLEEQMYSQSQLKTTLNHLGSVHNDFKNYQKSLFFFERSLAIMQKYFPQSQEVAAIQNNIAIAYLNMKNFEKSYAHQVKSIEMLKALNLTISDSYSNFNKNLGILFLNQSKTAQALQAFVTSFSVKRLLYKKQGNQILQLLTQVYLIYHGQGKYDEFNKFMQNIMIQLEGNYDKNSLVLCTFLEKIGITCVKVLKLSQSVPILMDAAKIYKYLSLKDQYQDIQCQIGLVQYALKNYQEAIKHFNQALQTIEKQTREGTNKVLSILRECYLNLNKLEEAQQIIQKYGLKPIETVKTENQALQQDKP